jgi:Pectate lyase superfamily protein
MLSNHFEMPTRSRKTIHSFATPIPAQKLDRDSGGYSQSERLLIMKQKLFTTCARYCSFLPSRCLLGLVAFLFFVCMAQLAAAAVIDVTTYGAIPNDSVDDSLGIQRAIDMAPDGSTIYFPRGTYLLAGVQIHYRSGLTLAGDGSTLTIFKRRPNHPNHFVSIGSTDMLVTQIGFDVNGIVSFGGFAFYDAKRITITKTRFFDSNKQPVGENDRFAWIFGRGSIPNEDILIRDNLIEDLQFGVDFGVRVRIEGNTVVRPVNTAGIGVFTDNGYTPAQDYTIQKNTIVDPVVSAGGIVLHLDPPSDNYSTMKTFRILDNHIVYTKAISGSHASAIRLGTGNNNQATTGNIFDDIVIQNNIVYKDPGSPYDFGDVNAIIFGNSSAIANFRFDNMNVSNNRIYCNNRWGISIVDIREKGINYVESNNLQIPISSDTMPPSIPTALTTTYISGTEIHLAWNPSVDNIGVYRYRIYRNGVGSGYSTTTSFMDKSLQPGVSYTYTVTAIDSTGNESNQSYPTTATTPGIAAPAVVVGGGQTSNPTAPTTTITVSAPTLSASPTATPAGGTITTTWNGIASPTSTDWIGLYRRGAPDASYLAWIYVNCSKTAGSPRASGSCPFVLPGSLASGSYELRLFANNGDKILARSNGVTVKAATLTANPASISSGGSLIAAWSGVGSPTSRDWIGLYQPGAASYSYLDWIYVSCSKTAGSPRVSGSCPFVLPASIPTGTYELRLFTNNGDNILATSNGFTVTVPKGRARHVARR